MAAVVRSERFYLGCGNLAGAIICLPLCWGLPSPDWAALKFGAAFGAAALGANAARLISQHSENAPIRAAWKESAITVDAAWIEQLAIANLPPIYQAPMQKEASYYLSAQPPQLNFEPISPATSENPQQPPERGSDRSDRKMPNLSNYPAVLIYGVPGTGKTTFGKGEVNKRLSEGHQVIVLDPHAAYEAWQGCEVVGGGMNYKAIDNKLGWLFEEVRNRYLRIENEPSPKFEILTVVAEEFTKWSAKVKRAPELFWTANTDIRKIQIKILFISHTRTLVATGGAKGVAALRDNSLLEVELLGEANEETGEATPLYQALVKMPGKALSDRYLVPIDRIPGGNHASFPQASRTQPGSSHQLPQQQPESPGSPYGMQAEAKSAIVAQILSEPGKLPLFSPALKLPHEEKLKIAKLIAQQNIGTEKLILCFWGATSGGRNHHLYVEARKMLDRLMEEIKNQPNCP